LISGRPRNGIIALFIAFEYDNWGEDMLDTNVLMNRHPSEFAYDQDDIFQEEKVNGKNLEIANQKIQAVLNNMTDGMLAMNDSYEILEANPVVCCLLESTRENLIGQKLTKVIDDSGLKKRLNRMETSPGRQKFFCLDLELTTGRALRLSVSLISKSRGYVIIIHDITAEKRSENLKNAFLSILSHELRTPLNGILISQQILSSELSGKLEPKAEQFLGYMEKSGKRMSNTIEELIRFAKLQHQELDRLDVPVSLEKMIKDVLASIDDKSSTNKIQLHYCASVGSDIVTGNPFMLFTLLHHVLDNAIVFGKNGGRVEIQLKEDRSLFAISIVDNGIGIPAAEIKSIFTSFYQVEEHKTRNRDGLGLGLAIAKCIVELHHGHISIDSTLGKGTTCLIRLPQAPILN